MPPVRASTISCIELIASLSGRFISVIYFFARESRAGFILRANLSTVHFLAKAYFADELPQYIDWFDKKAHGCIAKLTIPELIAEKQPLITEYEKLIATYRQYKDKRFIDRMA